MTIQTARSLALATELPSAIKKLSFSPSSVLVPGAATELCLLSKPFKREELREVLKRWCSKDS